MKRGNFLLAFCVLFFSFAMVSCSDDDDSQSFPDGASAKLLPTRIIGDKGVLESFYEYDSSNRLVSIKYTSPKKQNTDYSPTYSINYDPKGRIEKMTYTAGDESTYQYVKTYIYDNSKIEVRWDDPDSGYSVIEINEQDQILKLEQFDSENNLSYSENYIYNYGNLSIINQPNNISRHYSYDNKNGIFKHVNIPQWFLVSQLNELHMPTYKNNIKDAIDSAPDSGTSYTRYTITYVYNGNDYPVKFTNPRLGNYIELQNSSNMIGILEIDDNFTIKYKIAN